MSNIQDLRRKMGQMPPSGPRHLSESRKPEPAKSERPAVYPVDGELPEKAALIGDTVMLCYGDPQLIDSPNFYLPAIVTNSMPGGRVNIQAFFDVFLKGSAPDGRPVNLPSVAGFGNVPYNREAKTLTWCWREDLQKIVEKSLEKALEEAATEEAAKADAPTLLHEVP